MLLLLLHLVHSNVLSQRGRMSVGLVAAFDLAEIRLVRCMNVHVLFAVRAVGKSTFAAFEFTSERLFSCMSPLVNL